MRSCRTSEQTHAHRPASHPRDPRAGFEQRCGAACLPPLHSALPCVKFRRPRLRVRVTRALANADTTTVAGISLVRPSSQAPASYSIRSKSSGGRSADRRFTRTSSTSLPTRPGAHSRPRSRRSSATGSSRLPRPRSARTTSSTPLTRSTTSSAMPTPRSRPTRTDRSLQLQVATTVLSESLKQIFCQVEIQEGA